MRHRLQNPLVQLATTLDGDAKDLPFRVGIDGFRYALDKSVAFEPIEGAVDLPEVELPEAARDLVELRLEFVPVHRLRRQQPQNCVPDGHLATPCRLSRLRRVCRMRV